MSRRREYLNSMKLDLATINVHFIPVLAIDESASARRQEAIQILAQVIRLASKRGKSKGLSEEVFNEAA